jgi:hypothetical protein
MKKHLIFVGLVLISELTLIAQSNREDLINRESFESLVKSVGNDATVFNNYEGIKGTPYLFDFWIKGELVFSNDNRFNDVEMKFDLLEDNVLVKNKSGDALFLKKAIIKSFHLIDNTGNHHNYINLANTDYKFDAKRKSGFVEILHDGDNILVVKRSKHLKHMDETGGYSANKIYDEFRDDPPEYYWIDSKGDVAQLKGSKKSILKTLNDNGDLANHVKKERLSLRKEAGLISLMTYYDTKYKQ